MAAELQVITFAGKVRKKQTQKIWLGWKDYSARGRTEPLRGRLYGCWHGTSPRPGIHRPTRYNSTLYEYPTGVGVGNNLERAYTTPREITRVSVSTLQALSFPL